MVPLAAFTHFEPGSTPLAVNHDGLSVATTMSFNLAPGVSLSEAVSAYYTEVGDYPDSLQVLTQPLDNKPAFIEPKDLLDPWGQQYVYEPQNRNAMGKPRISSTHQTAGQPLANW